MCYFAELTGSQSSCQLNMRLILIVRNYAHSILLYCYYTIFLSLYLYNYTYTCIFVSALSDPTSNSERSANGGNKQIWIVLYCIVLYCIGSINTQKKNEANIQSLTEQSWSIKDLLYDLKHQKMIFDLAGPSEKSRAGSIAPSCPLG